MTCFLALSAALGLGLAAATSSSEESGRVLVLQRAACRQGCAGFTVTVHESGRVELERAGAKQTLEAARPAVEAVFRQVDAMGFKDFGSNYGPRRRRCTSFDGSQPLATLVLREGKRSKQVQHHTGCRGPQAIDQLVLLETAIVATLPGAEQAALGTTTVSERPALGATTPRQAAEPRTVTRSVAPPPTPESAPAALPKAAPPAPAPLEPTLAATSPAPAAATAKADAPSVPDERGVDLLRRFEAAYRSCEPDRMAAVVEMDPPTRRYFRENCSLCGGFEIATEPKGTEERGKGLWLRFHQAVRCKRSGTQTEVDLVAEVIRAERSPWRIRQIQRER